MRIGFRGVEWMSGGWEKGIEFDLIRDLELGSFYGDVRSCGILICFVDSYGFF